MAYLPYDPGDDVTELSPAVTQFTNNPALRAITGGKGDTEGFGGPAWEYFPNINQRNDPSVMAATGSDRKEVAFSGGGGYSGDPGQMGPAIAFAQKQEDKYSASIARREKEEKEQEEVYADAKAREEREKQEIANSPHEKYDPAGFSEAVLEGIVKSGGVNPFTFDVPKYADKLNQRSEQEAYKIAAPGKKWGVHDLTKSEMSMYWKLLGDKKTENINRAKDMRIRAQTIYDKNMEDYDKKWQYDEGLRKEARVKKEKEEAKAENLRRYKIAQDRLDKEKPNDFDKKTDFIRDRFGPNSLEMVNHMLGKKQGDGKKSGQNYLLEDKSIVTSFDGGRTFKSKDGKPSPMPFNAVKVTATIGGQDLSMLKAQKTAEKEQKITREMAAKDVAKIAKSGTGPYNMLAAAFDAIAGGMGIDLVLGKEGFFTETQENRQVLRTIKQIGKAALMNSSRGAIWEQQRIDRLFPDPDRFWRNPRTEMKKFETLREMLSIERAFNNEAIIAAVTPKEVSDLRKSNVDIDRLLALIKQGAPQNEGITPKRKMLLNKYPPKG